jgi:signal transduction histidine kinase
MTWSLRLRLVVGGIGALMVALTIAGIGLTVLFERHVSRTVADDLDVHLKQLIAGIDIGADGKLVVARPPVDPRFSDPLSGLYWQVSDDRGDLLRSRSLWDTILKLPDDALSAAEVHRHVARGPADARVLIAERRVSLTLGERRAAVRLAVATDLGRVSAATAAFARDLASALGLLGLVLAAATAVQVGLGLRPLETLRRGLGEVRSGRSDRLSTAAPAELVPLVEEMNALLEARAREVERSRTRAADLAHGLKTPLAALAADAGRLRERGEHAIARDIEVVGDAMSRRVDRELARARVRGAVRQARAAGTALSPLVDSLIATLSRTPAGTRVRFEADIGADLSVPIDRTDLAEVLGNLLDNAARHARSCVRIGAASADGRPVITIEDDGPGIAPAARLRVLERGARLDERSGAAGLGLAIVQDVLDAYGWRLELSGSDLGGLRATVLADNSLTPALSRSTAAPC